MTTLYIKTHNTTGLKYFGKTNRDPHIYKGSGTYWKRHLKIHGNNVTTEIHAQIDEITETDLLTTTALKFSYDNDIVKSPDWANLIVEDGLSGGNTFINKTKEEMNIIIEKLKATQGGKNNGMYGKIHSIKSKEQNAESHRGNKATNETKQKMSNAHSGQNNSRALNISIYNSKGDKVAGCCGNFKQICKELKLPFYSLQQSYQKDGEPIFQKLRNCDISRLKKLDQLKYSKWFAKINL